MTNLTIQAIVEAKDFGKPSAAKRGRNPAFPFVPVIDHGEQTQGVHRTRTEQIMGKAFPDREQAIAHAARVIEARKAKLVSDLAEPRMRALRKSYGLQE